jgi:hypothetical protein
MMRRLLALAAIVTLTGALGACAYDYLQHSDKVAYSSGDAVKANLAAQADDPANPNSDNVDGLGKNGPIEGLTGTTDPAVSN